MAILENIKSVEDLKNVPEKDIETLCAEIRTKLINDVSKTGGHLASNLGIVELTVALDRVYDPFVDRIVFDVGHQCYPHKILTGRGDQFDSLRQTGGLSGFPKPSESKADAFIAGHASNSISVALGMAEARTMLKKDYKVVAVIGDGALTGGLSFEGLENAGTSKEPLVIILNDNEMSISKNVGGVAKSLSALRTSNFYYKVKKVYRNMFEEDEKLGLRTRIHRVKESLKNKMMEDNMFADLGFDYFGPIDGHDEKAVEMALRYAKDCRHPVLIHVLTQKGKGYGFAEIYPDKFHGIGKFDPFTGELASEPKETYSLHFGKTLSRLADVNEKICAITAAMKDGTGLGEFALNHPDRFFDVGICEEHAVAMASGMASQGAIPVFCVYSSFLQRSYDMLIHDMSLQNLHVVIGVDHGGVVGEDGETHNGSFDIAYLRSVPHMTLLAPSNFNEMDNMIKYAIYTVDGPVAIRYPKGSERSYKGICNGLASLLAEGEDVTIISYGDLINEAIEACDLLSQQGIKADLIKLNQLAPLDDTLIRESAAKTKKVVVVEDCCQNGSIAEAIAAKLTDIGSYQMTALNLGNGIVQQGSVKDVYHLYRLDAEGIEETVKTLLEK